MKHRLPLLLGSFACLVATGQLFAQIGHAYGQRVTSTPTYYQATNPGPYAPLPTYTYPTTSIAAAPAMVNPRPATPNSALVNPPKPAPANPLPGPAPLPQQTAPGVMANDWTTLDGNCSCGPTAGTPWCAEPCGTCTPCGPCFYVGASGLIFTRNKPKFSQLSFDDTDPVGQVLSTDFGLSSWDAGPQVKLGWFMNECTALEFTYWGLYGDNQEATAYGAAIPGNLNTVFDFGPLNIGADNVNDLYDAAAAHRVRRDYDINNFELNLLHGYSPWKPGCNWQISYLAGIRYMRFAEDFQYASADAVPIFGADPANEVYYDIDVANNLWGFQLGGRADWYWTERFSVYAATKFGLFGNRMSQHSHIYNVNGTAVVGPGNPLAGQPFDLKSDKTTTSFIGELDLGISWRFTPRWIATLGYRAVAISGLAYSTDQIPPNFADTPGVMAIDSNADMILHGAYAGIMFGW